MIDRPEHSSAEFFVGTEVEHTAMYNQRTLFVIGVHPVDAIVSRAESAGVNHVYLGANMSFKADDAYDNMVIPLLQKDYWVTLDFDIKDVEWVLESGYTEYRRFIPMISAKLPYIDLLGYNACLKLDDKDFDATNPGVWVHSIQDLKKKRVFTNWDQYSKDEIIE